MKYLKNSLHLTLLFFVSVGIVSAQNVTWLNSVANGIYGVVPSLVALSVGLAVVYFLWGLVSFISNSGSEQARTEGRQTMVWGIIALFVIMSVWGLVALTQTLTGLGAGTTPSAPQTTFN